MSRRDELMYGFRRALENADGWRDLARNATTDGRRKKYEDEATKAAERAAWYLERANDK
jgi:hypothetical protein